MKNILFIKKCIILLVLFFLIDFLISIVLLSGLNKYFGFHGHPEILINGSSMSGAGFNRQDIEYQTDMAVAKYTLEGVSVEDRYAMIIHFFQKFPSGGKTVIYEVNPVLLSGIKTAENVYTHFYPYLDDKDIDEYIRSQAESRNYFIHKIIRSSRFDSRLIVTILKGYLGHDENVKRNTLDSTIISQLIQQKGMVKVSIDTAKLEIFENTISLIKSNNSNVVLVMMPMYKAKLDTFEKESLDKLLDYFEDYDQSDNKVTFINLNRNNLISDASYFSDPLHYNVFGQQKINDTISAFLTRTN